MGAPSYAASDRFGAVLSVDLQTAPHRRVLSSFDPGQYFGPCGCDTVVATHVRCSLPKDLVHRLGTLAPPANVAVPEFDTDLPAIDAGAAAFPILEDKLLIAHSSHCPKNYVAVAFAADWGARVSFGVPLCCWRPAVFAPQVELRKTRFVLVRWAADDATA
eukprot:3914907-Amphidinium_carterae.1